MTRPRRFSQAISEGDGISVIVEVGDADSARAAEEQGAEAVKVLTTVEGLGEATSLPILWCADGPPERAREAGADACLLVAEQTGDDWEELQRRHASVLDLGLECVIEVGDDEELELALERIDPEIFLLSSRRAEEDEEALDRVLDLLPDVPAGKLAIAEIELASRDDVVALERAGVDAVIVRSRNVAELVGGAAPGV
jgi:indole-3-glycerol phosphate synthase